MMENGSDRISRIGPPLTVPVTPDSSPNPASLQSRTAVRRLYTIQGHQFNHSHLTYLPPPPQYRDYRFGRSEKHFLNHEREWARVCDDEKRRDRSIRMHPTSTSAEMDLPTLQLSRLLFPDNPELRDQIVEWCREIHGLVQNPVATEEEELQRVKKIMDRKFFKPHDLKNDPQRFFAVLEEVQLPGLLGTISKLLSHFILFGGTILHLSSAQQLDEMLSLLDSSEALGCLALTELGHGSNPRQLETIARFDAEKQEFVIDTPRSSAQKTWISNGRHAQWAVVMAILRVAGKSRGPQAFVVPLRRITSDGSRPAPGVRLTACDGSPFTETPSTGTSEPTSYRDVATISFKDVRVPLSSLLARYGSVHPDGTYSTPVMRTTERFHANFARPLAISRLAYGTRAMTLSRVALVIALRYAFHRRQFGPDPAIPEVPIITHPVHQRRLLPHLATCYAMLFVGQRCKQQYSRSLTSGGELPSDPETWQLSTTFKIGASEHARDTLRTCTECCGGQGFISRNYLQQMKFMCDAAPTSEGDNTLLLQGIAKQLLGVYRRDFPKSLVAEAGYYVYLTAKEEVVNHWSSLKKAVNFFGAGNSLRDPAFLLRAFEIREQRLLRTLDLRLNKAMTLAAGGVETVIGSFVGLAAGRAKPLETGDAEEDEAHRLEFKHRQFDAWSVCMTHAVALGRAHVELVAMRMFHVHLLKAARTKACSPETLALLQRLCGLYGLCIIERDPWFLTEGLLTPVQMKLARLEVDALCLELAREEKDLFRLLDALRVDDVALQRTIAVPNWIDINYRLPTAGSAE